VAELETVAIQKALLIFPQLALATTQHALHLHIQDANQQIQTIHQLTAEVVYPALMQYVNLVIRAEAFQVLERRLHALLE
jgi:hypothetical protein